MRKFAAIALLFSLLCVLPRADVGTQAIKNGLSGTIISASVAVTDANTSTIYTKPTTGHFVLT